MDFGKQKISISDIREADLVNYLSELGFEPTKIRGTDYWYLSPLRDEKAPSFKVNRKINRWYDHGLGKGGNLIDFAILYNNCTVGEFLKIWKRDNHFSLQSPHFDPHHKSDNTNYKIKITRNKPLASPTLIRYLRERRIPLNIAKKYCREIHYELNKKSYYGIGFKNDSGGFEIRNPYFKSGSSPKDKTTLSNHSDEILVFEGFMYFLSFIKINQSQAENKFDFITLNSLSFFEKARPFMEAHKRIRLFLDNDSSGQKCSRIAQSLSSKYKDESSLYKGYKDFNDWIMNKRKVQKKNLRLKRR